MKQLFLLILLCLSQAILGNEDSIGLKVGSLSPIQMIETIEKTAIDLKQKDIYYILVFYRGSWCPYCVKQLESIQKELAPKLKSTDRLIAISVDKLKLAQKMKNKFNFSFDIVSDPSAKTLQLFKIANKLDDQLVKKYKDSYKIDVEADSGETHHLVAHPAVYIIQNSKIIYADIHLDYKDRTKNSEILKNIQ